MRQKSNCFGYVAPNWMFVLLLYIAIGLSARPILAQSADIKFTTLTAKDGLSSNTINTILKDKSGLLWVATEEGLNRYDGRNFKLYNLGTSKGTTFQKVEVSALHEDKTGRLWVGTMGNSLYSYDRSKDAFIPYHFSDKNNKLYSKHIKSLCSDSFGNIWFVTITDLRVLNPKTSEVSQVLFSSSLDYPKVSNPLCVYKDHKKRIWIGTEHGLYVQKGHTRSFQVFKHNRTDANSVVSDTVHTIAEDQNGQLWIGTSNGISQLSADERSFRNFKFSHKDSHTISNNFIHAIAPDQDNTIWIGTEGGLDVMDIRSGRVTRYAHDSRDAFSVNSKSIQSILIDSQGIHWVGTYKGGINKFDRNLTLFEGKRSSELDPLGLNAPLVTSFAESPTGDVFVGTDGGGLNVYHPKTGLFSRIPIKSKERIDLAGLPILSMVLDHRKQLWLGTYNHGLFRYDIQTGTYKQFLQGPGESDLNHNQIFCLKEDSNGNIWIGTNGGGVNRYNPETNQITKFLSVPSKGSNQLFPINNYIRAIEEDANGNIWIGSLGSGIAVYHPTTRQFTAYKSAQTGLALDNIASIQKDHRGNIWVGTGGEGLYLFDTYKNKFFSFSGKEGLPNGVIHKILEDNNGSIWVSTNQGVSKLNIDKKAFINYSQDNGLVNNAFLNGAGIKLANGLLFFGSIEGFNYFDPSSIKFNHNIPSVLLTELKVDNKIIEPSSTSPLQHQIAIAKEIHLNYKQNFSIAYTSLNYTLPQKNQYAYRLKGFDEDWNYVGSTNIAYYTNLDPGEYEFIVKASNNDGVWNTVGTSVKIIISPPFWKTIYAYTLYVGLLGFAILYMRYRGIKKLKKEFRQQQERKERERVRELDLLKIKFLTNLSHEFRTPISLILAPTDKLLAQQQDPHSNGQLHVIRRNARRLLHLVNQLLDFRKMEEHELSLNLSAGEITAFVREVTDSFQDLAEVKKIDLSLRLPSKKLFVQFDYDKVERILVNLLSNAFKFTPEGGTISVELTVQASHDDTLEKTVCIQVADSGVGIPLDKQELIFQRFFQGQQVASVVGQSSGIGLSITKEFVQLHGGHISVESELGEGTTFTVLLPLTTTPPLADSAVITETPEPRQEPAKSVKLTKKQSTSELPHLLIVEDDDEFRYYLKDNLKEHYKITDVLNGKDGWYKALACHPDLIVSDITMPYMDGVALSRKLKSDKRTSHIPIILLTGLTREEEQLKGLESGASDYLTKPFNFEILNAKIRNLLELNRSLKTTYTKQLKVVLNQVDIASSSEKFLNNVVLYIEKNLTNSNFSVEELSEHFGMSRGSMYSRILELTGMPPVEFIRSFKLDRAAVLLRESDLTISEIAYQVGFATPHYFTKSFKAKFSILPSDYRKSKKQDLAT
ncbi:hybrid sensor histidine kinase/response regulator transcription factor [Hymenobacter sp. GOD-10R]|uniref:hybrid sensor histidine kinase/response regulator transcription factor n=1 Tax=Hymenobacter sp. GOD-10R TaxID=3093922 RepID=UPI002D7992B3|nr:two-component regulator propeller domain-containing protein [Hymenobacter sp. GOD-10R]WRQ26872.1 two-component regulator propeller domain-containing protein [Hymenobacter sp. GOD-10R]